MTLIDVVRLLMRRAWVLVAVPIGMGATVFVLTQGQPQTYSAHTTLYTGLVSGYTGENSGGVDYHAVKGAFDNLIGTVEARSTLKTVALRMLAQRVAVPDSAAAPLRPSTRGQLREILPDSLRRALAPMTAARAEQSLRGSLESHPDLQEAIFSGTTPFSIPRLRRNLNVQRVGNSDLLEMRYTAPDPALCRHTLHLLVEEVKTRRERRQRQQVGDVVSFFADQVDSARRQLNDRVSDLRDFGVRNEVINYQEQTKAIAQARQRVARDLQQARTRLQAARSARDSLGARMDANLARLRSNESVLRLRRTLSDLSAKQALQSDSEAPEGTGLQRRIDTLRTRLTGELRRLYRLNHSRNGLSGTRILEPWLERVLAVTEAGAHVRMLEDRLASFQERYRTLAPLGSQLSGIKREVDIAENQYLELLNSLNQARLKRKMETQSALRVVDPPIVPMEPAPTNRLVLVAGSAGAGLILALGAVVALFLLDGTLRTPRRAEERTGLPLASAYPVHPKPADAAEADPLGRVETILDAQLLRALQTQNPSMGRRDAAPNVLLVTSTRRTEGKTYVAQRLCAELAGEAYRVLRLSPHGGDESPAGVDVKAYDTDRPATALTERVDAVRRQKDHDLVVVEIPALVERALPVGLAQHTQATLLVTRADRRWARADAHALRSLQTTLDVEPLLVLNGAPLDALNALVGQVPRARSPLRRRLERWLRFEFRSPLPFSS
ncbi:MAG: hypothetical protein GVY12_15655 [Bacteroidetes bacterium]|jgi:uncharacterized protein involved in exopolysaccharide biosynthesis|nr:hypothetical protein [Bacteroidota bacterium]